MVLQYLVRVGTMGRIGRFSNPDGSLYRRGTRVICRTVRGLEIGEVLTENAESAAVEGPLLRRMAVEDEILHQRLQRHRDEAFSACRQLLAERRIPAALVDVEPLFDGSSLVFYFLGEVTPQIEAVTSELAETYETKVQFKKFADTLETGCGPGCGTEEAAGHCGTGCTSCAIAQACKTHH